MESAETLKDFGYRIISRKFRIAARIDREDWEEYSKRSDYPVEADWYRRCVSRDQITVPESYVKVIGSSCHDDCGYVEVKEIR